MVKERAGRAMQEKERKCKGKKQQDSQNCGLLPIGEGVLLAKLKKTATTTATTITSGVVEN